MVGALIMAHSDDDGLVLPPRLAPIHVVFVPIFKTDEERAAVVEKSHALAALLREDGLSVKVDDRDGMKPGAKYYEWEQKGVPLRLEIGPRDLQSGTAMGKLRIAETDERGRPRKVPVPMEDLGVHVGRMLDEFQAALFDRALRFREENTVSVDTWDEFRDVFAGAASKFVWAHWDGTTETELAIKEATKASLRCIPLDGQGPAPEPGACVKTGAPSAQRVLFAKAY
jgi:prolyl-tRNA synthetase